MTPKPKPRDWQCECGAFRIGNMLSVAATCPQCGSQLRPIDAPSTSGGNIEVTLR